MEVKENNQKKLLLSVLGVAILVIAVIGISFAIYQATFSQTKDNSITTGTITVSYEESNNVINIEDAMPMTEDEAVKTLTGTGKTFKFTVSTQADGDLTVPYEVSITKDTEGTTLTDNDVRVYLKKGDEEVIDLSDNSEMEETPQLKSSLISNLKEPTIRKDDNTKLLYKAEDVLNDSDHQQVTEYELIMWLDSNYVINNGTDTKTYKAKVNVDSVVTPLGTNTQ